MQTVTHSDALSRFGYALSDPTRAEILLMLRDGPGYPSDLADKIGVSRQILSNHLACLRGCGLVVAAARGPAQPLRTGRRADRPRARRPHRPGAGGRPGLLPRRRNRGLLLMTAITETRRAVLTRRIRLLVAATITYNVVEAVVALAEGTRVSSSALIGFGLDSVVEISSAAAVAWQFSANDPETREKAALRFIAFSFFALAAYVTVDAVLRAGGRRRGAPVGRRHRARRAQPRDHAGAVVGSTPRRPRTRIASPPLRIPSRRCCAPTCPRSCWPAWCSTACSGWSWADPLAALGIAAIAVREGVNAWRGDPCCS